MMIVYLLLLSHLSSFCRTVTRSRSSTASSPRSTQHRHLLHLQRSVVSKAGCLSDNYLLRPEHAAWIASVLDFTRQVREYAAAHHPKGLAWGDKVSASVGIWDYHPHTHYVHTDPQHDVLGKRPGQDCTRGGPARPLHVQLAPAHPRHQGPVGRTHKSANSRHGEKDDEKKCTVSRIISHVVCALSHPIQTPRCVRMTVPPGKIVAGPHPPHVPRAPGRMPS